MCTNTMTTYMHTMRLERVHHRCKPAATFNSSAMTHDAPIRIHARALSINHRQQLLCHTIIFTNDRLLEHKFPPCSRACTRPPISIHPRCYTYAKGKKQKQKHKKNDTWLGKWNELWGMCVFQPHVCRSRIHTVGSHIPHTRGES